MRTVDWDFLTPFPACRLVEAVAGPGERATLTYDAHGRLADLTAPDGRPSVDAQRKVLSKGDPDEQLLATVPTRHVAVEDHLAGTGQDRHPNEAFPYRPAELVY